ncbi:hypothetical protein QAD02_018612 [Eretmocerus hayati]|uniref:Uncharacterized protein n=1 Tax=Eretmocerus hayati TaxID=131215 RepID=A0ACC2PHC0_9HYME|nr:hypothetical protein QAD02_018612 [Eretmocerus hayati]
MHLIREHGLGSTTIRASLDICYEFWPLRISLFTAGDIDARKTSRRGSSSGSGFSSKSSKSKPSVPQPAPSSSHGSAGSSSSYGWNTNQPKASAPSEHAVKSGATNVQSGYNPSGGYNNRPANAPPPYSPSGTYNGGSHQYGGGPPAYGSSSNYGGNHAPPAYGSQGGYGSNHAPPPYGSQGGYHGTPYGSYPGAASHGFSSSPGQGYNPSYGHSPSFGAQAPQTVILQSGGSRPGIGQMAKEAFVYAGVSAGVNAAVNRLLPGGIYGHSMGSSSSSGVVPPVSHTQITYNNYYNNGTAAEGQPAGAVIAPAAAIPASGPVPGAPATAPGAAMPDVPAQAPAPANSEAQPQPPPEQQQQFSPAVTNDELKKFTNELFSKDTNNAMKYINMKLQGQKTDDSVTDDAPENLLEVKPEAYEIPTVKAVLALHDNYELDVKTKEVVTSEERKEESDLIDAFVDTEVMKSTMKFLASKNLVPDDEYEFKDSLKRMWFSQFKRMEGEPSSSGFETIFLAEKFDNEIIGLHNWIYFAKQEEAKNLNYLGYIKKLEFSSVGAIVKGRSKLNDIVQPITTILVGTSPELEMALYTLCYYARPNDVCPITVGGEEFLIVANRVNYFGKDIIISAFPDI